MTVPALFAVAGVVLAAVLIIASHYLRDDLPWATTALSVYFTAPTRTLMVAAYGAISIALVSLACALATDSHLDSTVTALGCALASILLVPVVATTQRNGAANRGESVARIHRYAAAAAFAFIGCAMSVSGYCAAVRGREAVALLGIGGSVLAGRVLLGGGRASHGLRQKLCLAAVGLWVVAAAVAR